MKAFCVENWTRPNGCGQSVMRFCSSCKIVLGVSHKANRD